LITNCESALINPSDHDSISNDYHLTYRFPTNTSNGSCFTSFDLHVLSSQNIGSNQAVEAFHPSLMVISGPHCHDMPNEYDQIQFPSHNSHIDLMLIFENSPFQGFWGLQEVFFEFMIQTMIVWKHLT